MSSQTTHCSGCGKTIHYDSGLFSGSLASDGFFGHLCSTCAANEAEEKRHRERMREDERARNEAHAESERNREQREEYARKQEEAEERRAEAAAEANYEFHNPGEYECPFCYFDTLLADASRCPKCHGEVPPAYWTNLWQQQEASFAAFQAEAKRMAPLREAEALNKEMVSISDSLRNSWDEIFWVLMATVAACSLLYLSYAMHIMHLDVFRLQSAAGLVWLVCGIVMICVSILGFLCYLVVPLLAIVAAFQLICFAGALLTASTRMEVLRQRIRKLSTETVVKTHGPFKLPTPIDSTIVRGIVILGFLAMGAFGVKIGWVDVAPLKRTPAIANSIIPAPQATAPSNRAIPYSGQSAGQPATGIVNLPAFPGERFPATRLNFLTRDDLAMIPKSEVQYAINEMFARHGGYFPKETVRKQFERFSWYRAQAGVTWDEIEKRFTPIEKSNLETLAKYRDSGIKKN